MISSRGITLHEFMRWKSLLFVDDGTEKLITLITQLITLRKVNRVMIDYLFWNGRGLYCYSIDIGVEIVWDTSNENHGQTLSVIWKLIRQRFDKYDIKIKECMKSILQYWLLIFQCNKDSLKPVGYRMHLKKKPLPELYWPVWPGINWSLLTVCRFILRFAYRTNGAKNVRRLGRKSRD